MFKAICPHCSKDYTLDDSLLGKTANCRQCRQQFVLEENTATHIAVPSPALDDSKHDSGFELKPRSSKSHKRGQVKRQIPDPALEKRFSKESGMWNVGDVVLGIYEVKPLAPDMPFAEGGVGVVNRIFHREWNIDLAVKSPKPHVFRTENGKISYEKEAQTWIELGLHPNIVTCYLVRRIGDIPRLFSEFVPDGSLRDWIRDGRLYEGGPEASLLRILDIGTQFAWGLEHAHRQKLLHLDVKPANVMMAGQTAKVTDFGLAQGISEQMTDQTAAPAVAAAGSSNSGMTPGYCSPEQFEAFHFAQKMEFDKIPPITLQSDIWSWGVSVLSMFHGRPPCKRGGQTARRVFEVFLKGTPEDGRPAMPQPVVDLLFRCFEEDPAARPESMEQVADSMVEIYREISGMPFPRLRPVSATWTPESINNRAASMLDLGKPNDAAQLLNQAAEMQPWHPEVTYNQSLLTWRSGRMTDLEAVEKLETLAKTRAQSAVPLYALGLVQRERGNLQTAVDAFEQAMVLEPRDDIKGAHAATEQIAAKSTRCLERFQLGQETEDDVYVDDKGELLLTVVDSITFALRETATGRIRNTFKQPKEEQRRQFPNRLAISDDILWELVAIPDLPITLRRIGAPAPAASFTKVPWKRYFGKATTAKENIVTSKGSKWAGVLVENRVDIYDRETKAKIGDLFGHEDTVTTAMLSDDGRFAITGSADRTMRIWELPSTRCLRTFTSLGAGVDAVYLDKNGQFALSLMAGGALRIWDVSLLCNSKGTFRAPLMLSLVASAEQVTKQQLEMNERCTEIKDAVDAADYGAAMTAVERAKKLNGWEAARKGLETDGVWESISRHCVRKDLADALCLRTFVGPHDTVSSVVLSPDGQLAASTGRDQTIRVWNITEQRPVAVLEGHYDWVRSLAITSDAKFIVSGSWDMSVRVWNIAGGQVVRRFDEKVKSLNKIALNPQGRTVAIANGSGAVILWDVLSNETCGRFLAHQGSVNSIRFNRDGRFFVTGGDDNVVSVWRVGKDDPIRTVKVHKSPVTEAMLSTDLTRIVSGDREGRIVCWNLVENKKELDVQGHFGDVTGLCFLGDERGFLSTGKDMKLRVEGIQDRSNSRVIEGHASPILALTADISGRRVITGCDDATVNVWELNWNYEFPGWGPATPDAENIVTSLLTLYSPDPLGKETPKVDSVILKRILLEMEYRGYGTILPEELKQLCSRKLAQWTGPLELPQ